MVWPVSGSNRSTLLETRQAPPRLESYPRTLWWTPASALVADWDGLVILWAGRLDGPGAPHHADP